MSNVHLGDLAQSYQLRGENARLKQEMSRLTAEVASGRTQDIAKRLSGDLTPIIGIEHDLSRLEGYDTAVAESALLVDTLQHALETVQDMSQEIAGGLILVGSSQDTIAARSAGIAAREVFASVVDTLGIQVGGRSMLAGIATDQPALAPADTMLSALQTATAGLTSASDVVAAVDAWFGPGGDFETVGYTGAATALAPIPIGRNVDVSMTLTASDQRLRDVMVGAALGALVGVGILDGIDGEQVSLAATAGERLLAAQGGMATIRAEVGTMQAKIETAGQSNGTARHALEMARTEMISIDPYDHATRLESARIQLESLYALTARMSRMTLTDFLR